MTNAAFFESYNARVFSDATGEKKQFAQDNHSKSSRGVLRGLHYQLGKPQGKLVRVIEGSIFDVAVDIREGSPILAVGLESNSPLKMKAAMGTSGLCSWVCCYL